MNKKRFIFLADLVLVPLFILTVYTGMELHVAGHGADHEAWHDWAVLHTLAGLLFTVFGAIHVRDHWGWYKSLCAKGPKGRSRIVLALSVVCVPVLVTAVLLLCCVDGANTPVGLLHYGAGLAAGFLGMLHILTRARRLYNGLAAKQPHVRTRSRSGFPPRLRGRSAGWD